MNEQLNNPPTTAEIFKTNVSNHQLANKIINDLKQLYPDYHINFDLEDCDKILRIESYNVINIVGLISTCTKNVIQIELINC